MADAAVEPGVVKFNPARISPADVARIAQRAVDAGPGLTNLPTAPTAPSGISHPPQKFQMGEITDRDRFLDDASDRRAALMAASRVLADDDHVSHDEVTAMAGALYQSLREGKS